MLDPSALKDIRPFVATPCYSASMSSDYVRSLLGLVNLAWTHGFAMQTRFLDGDSLITRARNRLAAGSTFKGLAYFAQGLALGPLYYPALAAPPVFSEGAASA